MFLAIVLLNMIHIFWCSLEVVESEVYVTRGTCMGSKVSDCLGCAWVWAGRDQAPPARPWIDSGFETPNPWASGELLPVHKVEELHQAPGTYPSYRHTVHLQQTWLPELLLSLDFVVWFSQVKPEPNPWHTSCSFALHTNYRGRAAGSPSQDTNYPCWADPCPGLTVSTPEAVW